MATLPVNDRLTGPFIATAGQTDFPADFPLIKAEGLRVRRERGGVVTLLVPPAVTAVNVTEGGFTARLAAGAQAEDRLFVFSELPAARMRSHTLNGAVRTPTLEGDAEEFQAQLQEVRRDLAGTIRVLPGSPPISPEDVLAAAEAVASRATVSGSNVEADAFRGAIGAATPTFVNVRDFGAKGDGVTNDTEAFNLAFAAGGGVVIFAPPGRYLLTPQDDSYGLSIPDGSGGLMGSAGATVIEFITNPTDAPSTSVAWDTILISGVRSRPTLLADFEIVNNGGRRNNAAAVALRNGATHLTVRGLIIDDSIASSVVLEGSVTTPYPVFSSVIECRIKGAGRHGVYLSGVEVADVKDNWITGTGLEAIVHRNCNHINIHGNTVTGDGATKPTHGIAAAQPPLGVYRNRGVSIKGNRGLNIPGALYYGQGVGVVVEDSEFCENSAINCGSVGSNHTLMMYRWANSKINNNKVWGGRNRAITFYGCANNEVKGNVFRNVNEAASASTGAVTFVDYADPRDGSTTFSTGNNFDENTIVDDRATKLYAFGALFAAGSNKNRIGSKNLISGYTSRPVQSADPMTAQYVAGGDVHRFTHSNLPSGTLAATAMTSIGEITPCVCPTAGFLKRFVLHPTGGILNSGTITCSLFKNGSAFFSATFAGDGVARSATVLHDLYTRAVEVGDVLTAQVASSSAVVTAPLDVLFQIETANW